MTNTDVHDDIPEHIARMYKPKQAKVLICRELHAFGEPVPAIAARLKVSERSVHRYLRDLGGPRRTLYYEERMPVALAHLRRFPHLWFTRFELERVCGFPYNALRGTLNRMEREGMVVTKRLPRDAAGNVLDRLILWWQLAPGQEEGGDGGAEV